MEEIHGRLQKVKAKSFAELARSSTKAEVGHIKWVVEELEEKLSSKSKRKELDNALAKVHHKLVDFEARTEAAIQVGVEAYKLSKNCRDQNIAFSTLTYLEGKDEIPKVVVAHFPNLDLAFLNEDSEAEKEQAPRAKKAANPSMLIT